jgi:hypothetical protein
MDPAALTLYVSRNQAMYLDYTGGVHPEILFPDNRKTGVRSAFHYEPEFNPAHLALPSTAHG